MIFKGDYLPSYLTGHRTPKDRTPGAAGTCVGVAGRQERAALGRAHGGKAVELHLHR